MQVSSYNNFIMLIILFFSTTIFSQENKEESSQKIEIIKEYSLFGLLESSYQGYRTSKGEFIKHGKFTRWWINGLKIMEGEYHYGKLHGKLTTWHSSGQKQFEKEYENGLLHGKSISWYDTGEKATEEEYRFGKLVENPPLIDLCTIKLPFSLKTRIRSRLYIISPDKREYVCSHVVARSPNMIVIPYKEVIDLPITFRLLEETLNNGKNKYLLESRGASRTYTSHNSAKEYPHIELKKSHTFLKEEIIQKNMPEGKECILHIEGDREFDAQYDMNLGEFAKKNQGNFLVVTLTIEKR